MEAVWTVLAAVLSFAAGIITAALREKTELEKITGERALALIREQQQQIEYWKEAYETLRQRVTELEREVGRLKQIIAAHNLDY